MRLYPAREDWRQWIQNFPVSGIGFRKKLRFSPVSQKVKPQTHKFCIHLRKRGLSGYKIDLEDSDRTRTGGQPQKAAPLSLLYFMKRKVCYASYTMVPAVMVITGFTFRRSLSEMWKMSVSSTVISADFSGSRVPVSCSIFMAIAEPMV